MNSIPMHIKQQQTPGMFIDHIYRVGCKRDIVHLVVHASGSGEWAWLNNHTYLTIM